MHLFLNFKAFLNSQRSRQRQCMLECTCESEDCQCDSQYSHYSRSSSQAVALVMLGRGLPSKQSTDTTQALTTPILLCKMVCLSTRFAMSGFA